MAIKRKVETITTVNVLKVKVSTVITAVEVAKKVAEKVARVTNTMIIKSKTKILKWVVTSRQWST